ncbi:MAG: amidohydrolase [Bacteroidetes bacterium]|jgi:amidohydrolase|nr:amidohydrolase [Bacteroidota bacterium]
MNKELVENLVRIRRQIHANPEIGYQETETAALVCKELDKLGIPYREHIAKTGVVGLLKKGEGPCIVLRADMDALPIKEENDFSFKSTKKMKAASGVEIPLMHACGHDVHTAMLLGAAALLKDSDFKGSVKFIFQPSEEDVYDDPEHKSGGQHIVEAGELENVKAALALHVHPLLPVGKVAYKLGQALACSGYFKIEVKGKMAHAAIAPHLGIDAVLIASQLIQTISALVPKYIFPSEAIVIAFTKIHGGVAPNVIADNVLIEGTIRALDLNVFNEVKARMEKVIQGTALASGATISIDYNLNYPSLLNDKNVHNDLSGVLSDVFGAGNIVPVDAILGSEDFAFYTRKVPSMFYFLGAQDVAEQCYFLHHPKVVFNEVCIPYGSKLLAEGALKLLKE